MMSSAIGRRSSSVNQSNVPYWLRKLEHVQEDADQ